MWKSPHARKKFQRCPRTLPPWCAGSGGERLNWLRVGKQRVVTGMGTWHHVTWHCRTCSQGPGVNLSTHCLSQLLGLVVQSMHKCMRQPAVSSQLYLGYPFILYSLDSFKRSSHHERKVPLYAAEPRKKADACFSGLLFKFIQLSFRAFCMKYKNLVLTSCCPAAKLLLPSRGPL